MKRNGERTLLKHSIQTKPQEFTMITRGRDGEKKGEGGTDRGRETQGMGQNEK